MGVTVKDLARVAGVSTATVSRALRGFDSVDPETRQLVLDVAKRLDYVGSPAAAALSTGKAGSIGIITPFVDRLAFLRMLGGIEREMRAANMDLLLYRTGDPSDPHPVPPRKRLARRVDGFLILSVAAESPDLEEILKLGMPVTMFGTTGPGASSVYIDDRAGAAAAMDHLLERGHRRIAVIYGREIDNPIVLEHQRYLGCLDAMRRAGVPVEDRLQVPGHYTMAGGERAMAQLLERDEPPSAVFAFSDEMAYGAIQAMKNRGVRPGHDIAIIGYDGHEISAALDLSTISVPFELIGATAARELLHELGQTSAPRTAKVLPTELIARASTGTASFHAEL
ncbi:LacI family DNA-binding transcriptional regulator [Microbacterium deminutum]|uniref:LacI family DNA-binding transcriptional regulator n=1 Tax=Microbacterium deminutum TaxID=344164 RepID=A0ABN2RHY9_9MICO